MLERFSFKHRLKNVSGDSQAFFWVCESSILESGEKPSMLNVKPANLLVGGRN